MPVELFFNKDLGVIDVRSYGVVTRENLFSALGLGKKLFNESGINKVLVDTSEEKKLPKILDLHDFGCSIPEFLKVAIIITNGQPTTKRARFVANVAYVNGAHINVFTNKEDALEWLNIKY